MAKKRINTPFIVISLLVLAVLAGGAYTLYKLRQKNPDRVIAIADELYKEGDRAAAASHYAGAANLKKDPALFMKAGDILYGMTYDDDQNYGRAEQFYRSAAETDPSYIEAYEKMIEITKDRIEISSREGASSSQRAAMQPAFDRIEENAKAILRAQPDNAKAKRTLLLNNLNRWMSGVETSNERVTELLGDLDKLQLENPKDVEILYAVAGAKLFQATALTGRSDKSEMRKIIDESFKVFTDAMAADPQNAALPFRLAILNRQAAGIDLEEKEKYINQARADFDAARKLSKPEDTGYVDVMFMAAESAKSLNDRKTAEEIYREVLKNKPNEVGVRLGLARLLSATPGKIDEAIDLVRTAPPPDPSELTGMKGLTYRNNELGAKLQLANLLIDKTASATDAATLDADVKEATTILDSLTAKVGEAPALLRSRGKLEMIRGDNAAALTTLTKAWEKTSRSDPSRLETLNLLARANLLSGQTSRAKDCLTQLLNEAPDYTDGRILLAQTLLRENDKTNAKPHIDKLRAAMPDRPDIAELYMRALDPEKDAEEIKATYAKLPETNRATTLAKLGVAQNFKYDTEVKRLIDLVVGKDARDVEGWLLLSNYWEKIGKDKEKAIDAVAQGLKTSPEDPRLNVRMKELKGDKDVGDFVLTEIAKIQDPARRAQAMYQYWTNKGDEAKALEALQNWEKISPDDLAVTERLFGYYIAKNKIDLAESYGKKLIDANADKAGGKLFRWNLAMAKGNLDEARTFASDLTREHPEFAQSWLSLGQTIQAQAAQLGDTAEAKARYEEALPKYGEALSRQGTNVQVYLGLIQCSEQLKLYNDVRRYLEDAITKTGNPMFQEMLSNFEVRHGDPEKVIADREKDLKADPEDLRKYVALADVYRATAGARNEKGDEKGAMEYVGKGMEVMSRAVDKYPDNIRLLLGYSELALIAGKGDDAEKRWKTYADGPGKAKASETAMAMSAFYRRSGKAAEAEKTLRDALKAQGDKPDVMLQMSLANVLSEQNKLDDALQVLGAKIDNPEVMRMRIELLLRADKRDEAAKLIDQAIASAQGPSLDLRTMRGAILLAKGDDAAGMKEIEDVLKQDPNNMSALIQRGRRGATMGRTNDAINDLSRVRDMLSGSENATNVTQAVQVRLMLAEAYRLAGQTEKSIDELEAALAIDKANKGLRLQLLATYLGFPTPRLSDAERVVRNGKEIPALANDPDMLAAEASMWNVRKDHQKARAAILEALKRNPESQQLVAQLFKIMLDGRQYPQLIRIIDQQPDPVKTSWWAMRDRAAAVFNTGDKRSGLAAFDAVIQKTVAEKNYQAVGSILNAAVEADNGNIETGLKLLGDRINSDPQLKLQAIQLYMNKPDYASARKLVTELLAQGDQLPPEVLQPALQSAAMAWSSDPGRDDSKAEDAYLRLAKLQPDNFVVWNNLASLENIPPEKALEYSKKANDILAKSNRTEPYVMDTYGAALLRAGKTDEGVAVLSDAYNALKFREVCLHLAEGYIAQKQWDAATARLDEAQSLYNRDVAEKRIADGGAFQEKIAAAQRTISANRK